MNGINFLPLETTIDGRTETQIVAVEKGAHLIGVVKVQFKERTSAAVRQLFVDPEYRKRGVGSELMRLCIHAAVSEKCQTIALTLAAQNRGAWPFYEKLGFIVAFEHDDGDLILAKPL